MLKRFYPHQKRMMLYAMQQKHPALFVEMRLGKTLVTLRRCALYTPRNPRTGLRVLVCAPYSALGGWRNDAEAEGCWQVWNLAGSRKARLKILSDIWFKEYHQRGIILTNKEAWIGIPEIAKMPWDAVVADESPFLKNPKARVTKFFMKNFRLVPHRWILTGTPCPEGEHEYFCQLAFCRGGAFGFRSFWDFRQQYMRPNPWGRGWELNPGAADHLRRVVGQTCCVMRRKDVQMEKAKVFEKRFIEFPKDIRKIYDKTEKEMILECPGYAVSTKWITSAWNWLRQLCGGFAQSRRIWDGKMTELLELAKGELRCEKIVVWCCYNQEVVMLNDLLNKNKIPSMKMTGADHMDSRATTIHSFSKGKTRVLVLQQAVAQTGMDLSVADTAIYYSSPPGQMARLQTEDRILSLKKKNPLLYIDIVVKDSVDEDVMEILKGKIALSDLSLTRALAAAIRTRKGWA